MILAKHHGGWVIVITMIVGIVMTIFPLPDWASLWRPAWVALILFYWCMVVPDRVGVGIAWCLGIILDILGGGLLGQHALGLCVATYVALHFYKRIRVCPLWQQGFSVFGLVFIYNTLILWTNGITGRLIELHAYLTVPLISMILWPWISVLLRDLNRRYEVY